MVLFLECFTYCNYTCRALFQSRELSDKWISLESVCNNEISCVTVFLRRENYLTTFVNILYIR